MEIKTASELPSLIKQGKINSIYDAIALVASSTDVPTIANVPRGTGLDVVGAQLDMIVGMVGAKLPEPDICRKIISHLVLNYGFLKPVELEVAVDCALQGKLNIPFKDLNPYGTLSLRYLSRILVPYVDYRNSILKNVTKPTQSLLPGKTDTQLRKDLLVMIYKIFDKYSLRQESFKYYDLMVRIIYDNLSKIDLVPKNHNMEWEMSVTCAIPRAQIFWKVNRFNMKSRTEAHKKALIITTTKWLWVTTIFDWMIEQDKHLKDYVR